MSCYLEIRGKKILTRSEAHMIRKIGWNGLIRLVEKGTLIKGKSTYQFDSRLETMRLDEFGS